MNWWEHLFNHTAKKIKTDQTTPSNDDNSVKAVLKQEKSTIDEKKSKTFDNKNLYYSRFQKVFLFIYSFLLELRINLFKISGWNIRKWFRKKVRGKNH